MKVLEKGKDNQAKCPCCGSTLEFGPADVSARKYGTNPDTGEDHFSYGLQCVVCKHLFNLGHLNPAMRSRVDEVQRNRDQADQDL